MKYEKAQDILPKEILKVIQEYIDGEYLYIPRKVENKKTWGESSGVLKELEHRNKNIYFKYTEGYSVRELSELYFLSESSIRRIIRLYRDRGD
ncbi:CD3324 family protein [Clostridium polynesiense]|uniref:CD3324 family protein n=1 Tax=Clostridium polynesiense TaxID=1325933 RepID=UPI00058BD0B1|nr:CD3324 family protein [Clostridium polynesiense]